MLFFCALSILHSSLISNTVFVVCSFIFYFNSTKLREIVNFSHWNDWKQWKQSNKYTLRNVNTENTDSGRAECVWGRHSIYGAALPGSVHICSFPLQNSYLQDTWKMEGEFCIFGYFLMHATLVGTWNPTASDFWVHILQ